MNHTRKSKYDAACEMYEGGLSLSQVAEKFGVSTPCIRSALIIRGVTMRKMGSHGADESTRKKMSEAQKRRCTPEERKARSIRYSTQLDTQKVKEMYENGMTQTEIAEHFGVVQKIIWRHMKNNGIKARNSAKRNQRKDANHMWKGDEAKYKAFHLRIRSEKGPAKNYPCSVCKTTDAKLNYDWANLTGKYEDINDYAPMCRSCHRKYDKKKSEVMQSA